MRKLFVLICLVFLVSTAFTVQTENPDTKQLFWKQWENGEYEPALKSALEVAAVIKM